MRRAFLLLTALAMRAHALDGDVLIHDPSTVIEQAGHYYVFGTGNGLPMLTSDDGWTWRRGTPLKPRSGGSACIAEGALRGAGCSPAGKASASAAADTPGMPRTSASRRSKKCVPRDGS